MATKDNKKTTDKREVAIKVENVSKTFRIPHEKHTSLKSAALNAFEKKTYEEFVALKDVSFEVKKGEFFGIIGRNGSGKSTLLKILAGIYMPGRGKVDIKGKFSPFLELGVGFNPELTGRENIFLGGAVLGLSKKEIEGNFDKIVAFSELEEFVDMKFKNFSSGMQVRLAFALSIFAHADILLMDEVLAVGDSNFQNKCMDEFSRYKKEGKTVVLVSHSMDSIEKHCDRVLYLEKGKIKGIGNAIKMVNIYNMDNVSYQEGKEDAEESGNKDAKTKVDKKAIIEKAEFLDRDLKNRKIFITGDKMTIRVHYKANDSIKLPVFGIAIYKDMEQIVYGTGNERRGVVFKSIDPGRGYVDFVFEQMPLLEGSYQVSVALGSKAGLIEKQDRKYFLKFNNGKIRDYGAIRLTPKVKLSVKNTLTK